MIRTILGSVREYKAATFQTIFLAAIEAVFEIVIPFWMSYLIDRGIEAGDMRQVAIFGGLLLLFAALQCATGVGSAYRGSYASAGYVRAGTDIFLREHRQVFDLVDRDAFNDGHHLRAQRLQYDDPHGGALTNDDDLCGDHGVQH